MPSSLLTKCCLNTDKIRDNSYEDMEHVNSQIAKKSIVIILVTSNLVLRKTVKAAGITEKIQYENCKISDPFFLNKYP